MDNNNRMEYNDQKARDRQERQEKIEQIKRKINSKLNNVKSMFSDFKEKNDAKKNIRIQAKLDKQKQKELKRGTTPTNNSYVETQTITNQTIMQGNTQQPNNKKRKPELSEQEKRKRKNKRSRIIRNIMTIPEIVLIVLLVLFLKDKYIEYSHNVHQTLIYTADKYEYEIKRDNNAISVVKKEEIECTKEPCKKIETDKYQVNYDKKQMIVIRTYFDLVFKFKSKTKKTTMDKINTDIGKRCIRAIIHRNSEFINVKTYSKYKIEDYEQMSEHEKRGFIYENENDKYTVTIALGEKSTGGYSVTIPVVYKKGNDLYIYVLEQKPSINDTTTSIITHPSITIQLEERPGNIKVYEIDSGEEFIDYADDKYLKTNK